MFYVFSVVYSSIILYKLKAEQLLQTTKDKKHFAKPQHIQQGLEFYE